MPQAATARVKEGHMIPLNQQKPVKQELRKDGVLEVVDVWYTIQGEGPFVGCPAVFVRLFGCNLQCPDCDTDYTSRRLLSPPLALLDTVTETWINRSDYNSNQRPLIVITGGEPFRQDIAPFVREALQREFRIQIETNGTLALEDFPYATTTTVCSPKGSHVHERLRPWIKALKYVIEDGEVHPHDGLPTTVLGSPTLVARPWEGFRGDIYLQPSDQSDRELNEKNVQAAVKSCMKYGYRLCLQMHKYAGLK
jgi:7-carboxy-7-deazaguanine synthase